MTYIAPLSIAAADAPSYNPARSQGQDRHGAEPVRHAGQARAGVGADKRSQAIAAFATALVERRGHVDTAVLDGFKADRLSESDLLEIVANVVATTLTNYTNNVARTDIDFPVVPMALAA